MTPEDLVTECPDCGAAVLAMPAQGGMRLDWPAVEHGSTPTAIFGLMNIGGVWLAGAGGKTVGNLAHELHEHQPPERE